MMNACIDVHTKLFQKHLNKMFTFYFGHNFSSLHRENQPLLMCTQPGQQYKCTHTSADDGINIHSGA